MTDAQEKQAEIDAWMSQVKAKAREYIKQGLSPEAAEERAVLDIRREIRGAHLPKSTSASAKADKTPGQAEMPNKEALANTIEHYTRAPVELLPERLANWLKHMQGTFDFLRNDPIVQEHIDFLVEAETWVRDRAPVVSSQAGEGEVFRHHANETLEEAEYLLRSDGCPALVTVSTSRSTRTKLKRS